MTVNINIEEIPDYKLGETPEDLRHENPNLYRCINAKRALRAGYEDVDDTEACITDMLADLRHLCDACDIDFSNWDRVAYNNYTAEKQEKLDNMEEVLLEFARPDSKRKTLTKEDWIEIHHALEVRVNYRIDNETEFEDAGCEWLSQLCDIMSEIGPDGRNYWPESKQSPADKTSSLPPACDTEGNLICHALSTWICPICDEKVHEISFRHIAECGIPYCSECDADMNLFMDEE